MVKSTDEAMNWFLSNSSGTVTCERPDGETKEVDNFPDAKAFFEKVT